MRVRVNSPHVISETIDGETIIIHLGTGVYYSIQGDPGLWDAISTTASIADLAALAQSKSGVSEDIVHSAVLGFVHELRDEDLVVVDSEGELPVVAAGDAVGTVGGFSPPRLTKYTDMKDLVLLDPVHDVGDAGWPQRPPEQAPVDAAVE